MAAAHQHSGTGMKRSTRFLNRLFPWRQSTSSRSPPPSSSSSVASSRMASAVPGGGGGGILKETMTGSSSMSSRGGGGGHHRRTSPVDLHLGEPPPSSSPPPTVSQYAVPRPPPSPYEMVGPSSPPSSHQQQRFVSFPTTAERAPATTSRVVRIPLPPPMVIPQHEIEREELNALRQLASELHSALRLSEQENILLKAKLQTMDDWGLMEDQHGDTSPSAALLGNTNVNVNNNGSSISFGSQTAKLDQLIEDLREIGSSQPSSPYSSPYIQRRNMRELGRILQQRQTELRRLTAQLHQTQTELLFNQVELDGVRRCLRRLDQRLLFAEEELDLARQGLLQASISKQRLMQELQTTRGLLMRCWARVRVLEQQHEGLGQLPIAGQATT